MRFSLDVRDYDLPRTPSVEYVEEDDDVTSLIADICEAVADCGKVTFRVSGFGQDPWPVDVRTDLPVFLEQLPAAIRAAERGDREFTLDFYEQGLERVLLFTPNDGSFSVRCESATDWTPYPTKETITAPELGDVLLAIRHSFLRIVRAVAPEHHHHPWLVEWRSAD